MYYEVVPVTGGMAGGHYAVRGPSNRIIGKNWGLNKKNAGLLAEELTIALQLGKSQRVLLREQAEQESPVEGQEAINK